MTTGDPAPGVARIWPETAGEDLETVLDDERNGRTAYPPVAPGSWGSRVLSAAQGGSSPVRPPAPHEEAPR